MDGPERRLRALVEDADREIADIERQIQDTEPHRRSGLTRRLAKTKKRRDAAAGALRKYLDDRDRR